MGDGPGVLTMLKSLVAAPFEERMVREASARHDRLSYEAANMMLEQTVRLIQPEDNAGFTLLGRNGDSARKLDPESARELRQQATHAAYRSPLSVGYLRTLKRFVMGKGPTFVPQVTDERLKGRIEAHWKLVADVNNWDELEDEIPGRTWRDGETFLHRTVQKADGPVPFELSQKVLNRLGKLGVTRDQLRSRELPAGTTFFRLIDADQIIDPDGVVSEGILTSDNDVQTVLGYLWSVDGKTADFIPADEMLHTKINVDSDVKRGRSILEPILKRDKQFDEWLTYRIALSLARSAVVLIRKIEGASPTQVREMRDKQQTQREDQGNDRRVRAFKPMSTITAGPGMSYEFKAPNVQAADAQHDGRAIQLNMAAATGLPEYMFTGDASNANYASTLVAEGPAHREFESWQDFFTPRYRRLYRWAMMDAADAGAIDGLSVDGARTIEVDVHWPNIEVRDEQDHAKANEIRHRNGVLSREGWALDDGIEWEAEKVRIEKERMGDVEFTAPPREE